MLRGPARVPAVGQVFVDDLDELSLQPDDAHHLVRSLRLRAGETIIAADGRGSWRRCRFTGDAGAADGGPGLVEADGQVEVEDAPAAAVTVAFVPVKAERPEWVVQKLTEIGVDRVVVLRSARSVVRWDAERAGRTLERLRRVAREAAAQSRRAWLPAVEGVWDLGALAASLSPAPVGLADPGGAALDGGVGAVAVGPEGGWEGPEREAAGVVRVGLGPTILRAETAALSAGTLLCALRDGGFRAR